MKSIPHPGQIVSFLLTVVVVCGGLAAVDPVAAQNENWESWSAESYTLEGREAFQFKVRFEDIPVRQWKLTVNGGDFNCDLSVLRVNGESLIYYKTDESRHEVLVPWGIDEEIFIAITNREHKGAFVVSFVGPPKDQVQAAYSYLVNRSLEAFASGRRLEAEDHCQQALVENPDDSVAKVLLAGFLRDRHFYDRAATLVDDALAGDLSDDMRRLAEEMRTELVQLRAPLPAPVRNGVVDAERHLEEGNAEEALDIVVPLLESDLKLDSAARSRLWLLRGQALDQLERNFEAVDAFTQALTFTRSKSGQAMIYFHMGSLFMEMDNYTQAQGAYTIALEHGLPSGLELRAREALGEIDRRLSSER